MLSQMHAEWLEKRAIDLETATRYGVHTEQQRSGGRGLGFPYVRAGQVIKNKIRLPGKRFVFDRTDAPHAFWNEDCLRDPSIAKEPLVICEGEIDAISVLQSGFPRVVSVDGGANSNLDFIGADLAPLMKHVPVLVLAGDGDEPGRRLSAELARRLSPVRCRWLEYPEKTKDLNDVLMAGHETAVQSVLAKAKPFPIKGLYRFSDYPDTGLPVLFQTGFSTLNEHMRLWAGEFVVITGVPNYGKSRFAINLAANMTMGHGHKVVMASFEMRIKPYVRDVLREVHAAKWTAALTAEEKSKADDWMEEYLYIIDQEPRDVEEEASHEWMIARAEDAVMRHGVSWFLLDPWNQVEHKKRKFESTPEYQSRAIKDFKRFARSYDCGVWIVTHPTKDVRDRDGSIRKPSLYDIDGSAHWYNAADHGVIIHGNLDKSVREVWVQKSRYWTAGKPGSGYLKLQHGRLVSA